MVDAQNQPLEEVAETNTVLPAPTVSQPPNNSSDGCQPSPIDTFIDSISRPLPQPLLEEYTTTPMAHQIPNSLHAVPPPSSGQRQSTRLAKKATSNLGKGAIQIAQELLIKKLGDLSGIAKEPTNGDFEFEFYAQHFERPMEKNTMEAIQELIEQGNISQKKGHNQRSVAAAPEMVA
jgi:hypothetical protein